MKLGIFGRNQIQLYFLIQYFELGSFSENNSHICIISMNHWYDNWYYAILFCLYKSIVVYYSIGFTKSTLEFWRQISKRGGGALLINVGFVKPTPFNISSYILFNYIMFLIGAIKPIVENKFKRCFIFYVTV